MIFNSQGDAKLRIYINGGAITPGPDPITLPKGGQLLGDLTIEAADTDAAYEEGYNSGYAAGYEDGYNAAMNEMRTLLFLNGDSLTDGSIYSRSITNNGVTVSTAQSKIGGKSLYFNGSSYLSLANIDFCNGKKDFTLDWWEYRIDSTSGGAVLYQNRVAGDGGNGLIAGYVSSTPTFYLCSASGTWDIASAVSMGDMLTGQWVHRAIVRNGNNFHLFQNGVLKKTISSSAEVNNSGYIQIGTYYLSTYYKGYIEKLRISSYARWTANFNPPTEY